MSVKVVFNPEYMSNKCLNERVNLDKLINEHFSKKKKNKKNKIDISPCNDNSSKKEIEKCSCSDSTLKKNDVTRSSLSNRETLGESFAKTGMHDIGYGETVEVNPNLNSNKKVIIEHLDTITSMLKWRDNHKDKILFLSGSPKVGKTYLIKTFIQIYFIGHNYYIDLSKYSLSNLLNNFPNVCFSHGFNDNRKTIVVFDNIDLYPTLIPILISHFSKLKSSLCLVGRSLDDIEDYDFYKVCLSPLTFKEFVLNLKLNDILLESLDAYYSIYSKIGGYPQIVSNYINNLDISKCQSLLNSLIFSDLLSIINKSPWEEDWGVYLHNLSGLLFCSTSLDYSFDSYYLSFLEVLLKYNYLSYLDNIYYFSDLGLLNLLYMRYHSDLSNLYPSLGLLYNFILLNSINRLSSSSFDMSTKSYHVCLDNISIDLKRVSKISDVYSF